MTNQLCCFSWRSTSTRPCWLSAHEIAVYVNAAQACTWSAMCKPGHGVLYVQWGGYYAHKYTQMLRFAHAHDTAGFQQTECASCACASIQRVGDSGQGQGRDRLVSGEHTAPTVAHWGQLRECGVLRVQLMRFHSRAKLWGELISKQATKKKTPPPLRSCPETL